MTDGSSASSGSEVGKRVGRWFGKYERPIAFGFVAPAAIAFGSLLAEDLFPNPEDCSSIGCHWSAALPDNWNRLLLFVAFSIFLAGLVWDDQRRQRRRRARGTLYYVRLQASGVPDLHIKSNDEERGDALDYRSVSRWVEVDGPQVDAVEQVEAISAELERSVNDDDESTGYNVAPNLTAAAGLALGYAWLPRPETVLKEYESSVAAPLAFSWKIAELKKPVDKPGNVPGVSAIDRVAGVPEPEWRDTLDEVRPNTTVRSVYLAIVLSTAGLRALRTTVDDLVSKNDYARASELVRVVAARDAANPVGVSVLRDITVRSGPPAADDQQVGLPPELIAATAAHWIQRTRAEFPEAIVILELRLPKTVTVATGVLLARDRPKLSDDSVTPAIVAPPPWGRLVTIGYFHGYGVRLMRVHRHQPDAKTALAGAGMSVAAM